MEPPKAHFFNLTNGIEWMDEIDGEKHFIRIQSTACEQKRWRFIIEDLDYTFLMRAAAGYSCIVYDASAKKNTSRAIYQGLEWIKYALSMAWTYTPTLPIVRGHNCSDYFAEAWREMTPDATRKLRYVKRFYAGKGIHIEGVCRLTDNDGNYPHYVRQILLTK